MARACWSLPVGAALGGAAYPPGVLLLRPEALAETQGSLGKADHQRPVGLQAVKVGRRVQTSRAGPAELEVLVNRKASAVETEPWARVASVAKIHASAREERRLVVEVAADSTAAVVVAKEDLVGENVPKVEVEAGVPVSCPPEEPLE